MFVKLARLDSESGKGSFWTVDSTVSDESSPSKQRRPKYMKDFGAEKAGGQAGEHGEGEANSSLDISLLEEISSAPLASRPNEGDGTAHAEGSKRKKRRSGPAPNDLIASLTTLAEPERGAPVTESPAVSSLLRGQSYHTDPLVKPPFSLSVLICQAIVSSPGNKAHLSDIVSWIMATYPHYREKNTPWEVSQTIFLFRCLFW